MAKGIAINGQLRGKLGGTVYYRAGGEQISRSRNTSPANPRTILQQRQRAAFATMSQAQSSLRTIVDHSFEGVKYGQPSLSRFAKENLGILGLVTGEVLNYNIKGSTAPQLNPYRISTGSLPMVDYTLTENGLRISVGSSGLSALTTAITTQAQYEAALAVFGCVPGDQLTIVQLGFGNTSVPKVIATRGNAVNYAIYPRIARIVFVNEIPDGFNAPFFDDASGLINQSLLTRAEGVFAVTVNASDNSVILTAGYAEPCAALVRSQQMQDGKWARSTSVMQVLESYEGYAKGIEVEASYGDTARENVGSSKYYLNNALTKNPTAGE